MGTKTCVYAGTFDPLTSGHLHIIKKACKIFDNVVIVIAQNPNKKTLFSISEREEMVKDATQNIGAITQIEVTTLPNHEYLVSYANSIGAKYLIRGIRDNLDFLYEQNICITNKRIQKDIETIYLIPDENYGIISSSWVKGLVGMNGWRKTIQDYVTPYTLKKLEEKFLKDIFYNTCDKLSINKNKMAWNHIIESYSPNEYHNLDHLVDGIEGLNKFYSNASPEIIYAWFMHDIEYTEDESIDAATGYLHDPGCNTVSRYMYEDKIKKLIEATKHKSCEYETDDEKIFASIDLLCLSGYFEDYEDYKFKVYNEYLKRSKLAREEFDKQWGVGRSEFLKKMLKREFVYSYEPIRNMLSGDLFGTTLEKMAMNNMKDELDKIN